MSTPYKDLIEAAIDDVLTKAGSTESQRSDARIALLPLLMRTSSGAVVWRDTGTALDSAQGLEHFKTIEKTHFLPPVIEDDVVHQAFVMNNMTARGKLLSQVGKAEADRLAKMYGLTGIADPSKGRDMDDGGNINNAAKAARNNPWLDDSPQGEARRVKVIRDLGAKVAASFAKAAGRTLSGQVLRAR
jgi:hypothetical protein